MTVHCAYRSPMAMSSLQDVEMEAGLSLQEMADRMRLPPEFHANGIIQVNGRAAPRALWSSIRPRRGCGPIEVTFFAPTPQGGGDDGGGGKAVLTVVAAVALVVASGGLGGGQLGSFFGKAFAKGTIGGYLARAGLSLTGALLLGALIPPPTLADDTGAQVRPLGAASASGNQLEPNGAIPRVVGTMKVYPPFMAEPYVYYEGDDEVVEGVYALAGPHRLTDIRVNGAQIEELNDTVVETREGWPGDARISLVRRFARTEAVQAELSSHSVQSPGGSLIDSISGALLDALPQARTLSTRTNPDEHHIQISFPGGLNRNSGASLLRVPLRLRIREAGSETWRSLPELHFRSSRVRDWRVTIKLVWTEDTLTVPAPPAAEGICEARVASPGQTISPAGVPWAADSYFDAGSGDDHLASGNVSSSAVRHVDLGRYEASILLDPAEFPKGRYEIEITRGYAFLDGNYSAASYQYSGQVRDFFGYENSGAPQIALSRDGISDTLYLTRSVSLWAEHPAPSDDCALIAVIARNRALEQLSVVASGYVRDAVYQDPRLATEPDLVLGVGETGFSGNEDAGLPVYFEFDMTVPAVPDGVVMEVGGSSIGAAAYFAGGVFTIRTGDGSAEFSPDQARFDIPAADLAGRSGTLCLHFDPATARAVAWWRDGDVSGRVRLLGEAYASSGALSSDAWRGTNAGGVGTYTLTVPVGCPLVNFNGEISECRYWIDQLPPGALDAPVVTWSNWTATSRPAPHLRDILAGQLSARQLHSDLIDDAELVAWRAACEDAGCQVNAILEGTSVAEAARIVASAGYARLRHSEIWGVVRDYDRSAEAPCQIYSQRDTGGFSWSRSMPDLPDGLRVTFIDRERDYQTRQLMIWRNNRPGRLVEQVTYLGLVTEAEVRARVAYDLAIADYRGATYSLRVPAKGLRARRGSLIGVAHDMLTARSGSARVVERAFAASGDVAELWLDDAVQVYAEPYMDEVNDLSAVEDLSLLGLRTGIALQRADGSVTTHELAVASGLTDHITFAGAVSASGLLPGTLAVFGPLESEAERFIVADIRPRDQLTFDLTLVDEAPGIWAA
ncbi:MAG: hypothetical protein GYB53_15130 [Rhodobacteraceae bacterium]|nr:hypothetical protein [Paracoccaceae bacterium]MBR9823743.1 hypothetical protein [Paracoccaceae bacterium]